MTISAFLVITFASFMVSTAYPRRRDICKLQRRYLKLKIKDDDVTLTRTWNT